MDDLREAVRQLHRPEWRTGDVQVWLDCGGCDWGEYAEGPPSWPCRTAELVYSPEEIAAREPQVPECPEDHRTVGEGPPVRAQAVFLRQADGTVVAARWHCDHVAPVPVTWADEYDP